jgi:hypothetical protein
MAMKTDEKSEEAEEPSGTDSGNRKKPVADVQEENAELAWARRNVPEDPADPPAGPATYGKGVPAANAPAPVPGAAPAAAPVFRKTEFWDRAPVIPTEKPVVRRTATADHDDLDLEIPYKPLTTALRNMTEAIARRQERIGVHLAGQVNALNDRIDALEDRIEVAIYGIECRVRTLEKERES